MGEQAGWCEGSGVSGDRFASGDSPIHLSLTPTAGARGEQSAGGQDDPPPSVQTQPDTRLRKAQVQAERWLHVSSPLASLRGPADVWRRPKRRI